MTLKKIVNNRALEKHRDNKCKNLVTMVMHLDFFQGLHVPSLRNIEVLRNDGYKHTSSQDIRTCLYNDLTDLPVKTDKIYYKKWP